MKPSEAVEVDIAIIGAGLSGIAFARFYLDTHPKCRIVVLEKDASIGGVWSSERVFDAFWVQSPLRMTSFSDIALTISEDTPKLHDTFEAKYVTQYLEDYVDNHVYNGTSLRRRIKCDTAVHCVEKDDRGWILHVGGLSRSSVRCKQLAVASGLTSSPVMPSFPKSSDFKAPMLHHRDFGLHSEAILAASSVYKHITVLGGGKSAADMIYAALGAGKDVNWIVRKSGEGPGIFMNPAATGRYKNNAEAGATQKATALNPSGFRPMAEWAKQLHQSDLERADLESKLFASDRRYKAWADYKGRKGALPGFSELEPSASFFWNNGPVGMIQHDNFWDLVSQKANVYRSDLSGTTPKSIMLKDGREVPTDILLCGTGWNADYPFLPKDLVRELGLPHEPCEDSEEDRRLWNELMEKADREIMEQYPILARPPPCFKLTSAAQQTPARLYHGIASLNDPSIIFLGRARMSNNFRGAEAQAVWATAYWDGHVRLPPFEKVQREVAYMNAFSRRRYPSRGVDGINFHTDLVWYTDVLLHEAGLESHRKGWWTDPEEPCLASDYADCANEYIAKYGYKLRENFLWNTHF